MDQNNAALHSLQQPIIANQHRLNLLRVDHHDHNTSAGFTDFSEILRAATTLLFAAVNDATLDTYARMEGGRRAFNRAADSINAGIFAGKLAGAFRPPPDHERRGNIANATVEMMSTRGEEWVQAMGRRCLKVYVRQLKAILDRLRQALPGNA